MKIRINFDNTQMKIRSNGKIESRENKNNPAEAAFCEIDLNLLGKLYKMFPPINILHNINKPKRNIPDFNNQTYEDGTGIPTLIPANGHDIYNYTARYGAANFQIQAVLKLDGRLDPEKLKKAVRLSIDAEPVLGCRFIENDPPYWKRLNDIDKVNFCSFETTDNMDEAVQRFLDSPFSMDNDPMVKLKLISSGASDTLCLKINHTCCDGTGAKEYFQLLSDIYTCIDQDNGVYEPKPSKRSRRDQDRLFDALGIKDPETAWNSDMEIPDLLWTFPWRQGKPDIAQTAICRLPDGYIDVMYRYGKAKGASINDILLAALYRTMFESSQTEYGIPMYIGMAVDLRRYLPDQKAEAIRNFSGGVDTKLSRIANETFAETLSRVSVMMDKVKDEHPGLQSAVGLERVEKANFYGTMSFYGKGGESLTYTDEFVPVLTNLSFISKSLLRFGNSIVTDAYFIPPALSAPGILLCVSSYNGIMSFTVSYYGTQARREDIDRFLNSIKKEITEGCRL